MSRTNTSVHKGRKRRQSEQDVSFIFPTIEKSVLSLRCRSISAGGLQIYLSRNEKSDQSDINWCSRRAGREVGFSSAGSSKALMRPISSSGCSASGLVRCANEYCVLQFCAGLTVARIDHESIFPESISHRNSSGSRPWKPEASKRAILYVRPVVMTSSAMCVESCR